jgi:hypothetical protein
LDPSSDIISLSYPSRRRILDRKGHALDEKSLSVSKQVFVLDRHDVLGENRNSIGCGGIGIGCGTHFLVFVFSRFPLNEMMCRQSASVYEYGGIVLLFTLANTFCEKGEEVFW